MIAKDFKELQLKERAKLFCELLQYSLPKMQSAKPEQEKTKFNVVIQEVVNNG